MFIGLSFITFWCCGFGWEGLLDVGTAGGPDGTDGVGLPGKGLLGTGGGGISSSAGNGCTWKKYINSISMLKLSSSNMSNNTSCSCKGQINITSCFYNPTLITGMFVFYF